MLKCIKRFRLSQKSYGKLSKKEESILMKKRKNLSIVFGGIQDMQMCPDIVIFVGQPSDKSNPLKECRNLGITTIALVDTNCNPEFADLPIPANDDSISSIELILDALSISIATGQRMKVKGTSASRSFQEQKLLPQDLSQIVKTPSISELKIPSALAETLKNLNIETIDQLCRYDKNKLLKLKTINPSKYNLIKRAIIELSSKKPL
jgi:ribosomal protein S2